jgi:glycerol-3-phosphate O-acyltransferase
VPLLGLCLSVGGVADVAADSAIQWLRDVWGLIQAHEPWGYVALGLLLGVLAALFLMAIWRWIARPVARGLYASDRERRISALNERLTLPIAPFKLAKRQVLIEQLIGDPAVQQAIAAEVLATGKSAAAVATRARRYAREIVPAFSATLYFKIGARLARWVSRALYRVRIAQPLAPLPANASVVFVMNHRSNIDYILVTHLIAEKSALSYAVGEWARTTGVAQLIRLMGAYFLRRDSGNLLYRRVLASYVHRATAAGVTQAIFPEGGLSRNGALQPAKLGLLSYMVSDFDAAGARDVVFVPVGINYDRVLEDRVLTAVADAPKGKRPKFGFDPRVLGRFVWRNIGGRITGRWYRFSYACVSFGPPVSLRQHLFERGGLDLARLPHDSAHTEIAGLGDRLIGAVGRAVPVLPVALVAVVLAQAGLLAADRPLAMGVTLAGLQRRSRELMQRLRVAGATVYVPRDDEDYAIDVGVRTLTLRRFVTLGDDDVVRVEPGQEALVMFYANSIAHHLAPHVDGHAPVMPSP